MTWIGVVLMLLLALFLLLPGAYWVVKPEVPGWARPWMLWPLKSTGSDVLRMQGWAGVLIGIAWILLLVGDVSRGGIVFLVPVSLVVLAVAILVWGWSVAKSFADARGAASERSAS